MKASDKNLFLAQMAQRIATLEAQHIALKTVVDKLRFTLEDEEVISKNDFIGSLQEDIFYMTDEHEQRLGADRPEWEWQALAAAVPWLLYWFHPYLRSPDDEVH